MFENLDIAASGMLAQQQRISAVANDLANASTTGYKHTRVGFQDLIYQQTGRSTTGKLRLGTGVAATDAGRSFAQGALQNTGNPLDVAIEGQGFLRVRRADGTDALTRDGSLRVDPRGRLTTQRGELVQPAITVPAGTNESDISIGSDGTVSANNRAIGRIQLVGVRSPEALLSAGDNLFTTTGASGNATPTNGARLTQGTLEASNVDVGDSMTEMIDAQRSFQLASRAVQMQDQMLQIANQVKS